MRKKALTALFATLLLSVPCNSVYAYTGNYNEQITVSNEQVKDNVIFTLFSDNEVFVDIPEGTTLYYDLQTEENGNWVSVYENGTEYFQQDYSGGLNPCNYKTSRLYPTLSKIRLAYRLTAEGTDSYVTFQLNDWQEIEDSINARRQFKSVKLTETGEHTIKIEAETNEGTVTSISVNGTEVATPDTAKAEYEYECKSNGLYIFSVTNSLGYTESKEHMSEGVVDKTTAPPLPTREPVGKWSIHIVGMDEKTPKGTERVLRITTDVLTHVYIGEKEGYCDSDSSYNYRVSDNCKLKIKAVDEDGNIKKKTIEVTGFYDAEEANARPDSTYQYSPENRYKLMETVYENDTPSSNTVYSEDKLPQTGGVSLLLKILPAVLLFVTGVFASLRLRKKKVKVQRREQNNEDK